MSQIIDENILWDAAEKLRDKCDPADYKNIVLGLVFLKYVSDKYTAKYNALKQYNDGREDDEDYYISDHVFIVPKNALWDEIAKYTKSNKVLENGQEFNLGQLIDNAFIELEKNNLIVANYCLPFCNKNNFKELWNKINNSILKDGYFVGNFFGINDEWKSTKEEMTFLTKEQVIELFKDFEIIEFKEVEKDGATGLGKMKHWHIFNVIAKKK